LEYVEEQLGRNPGAVLENILNLLTRSMGTCTECCLADRPVHRNTILFAGLKIKQRRAEETERVELDEELGEDEEQDVDEEDMNENAEKLAAILNRHIHMRDWAQACMGRFPSIISPPELPRLTTLKGLHILSDDQYDDYESGPTWEEVEHIPDTLIPLGEINLVYLANQVINNPWTTFREYGYRIEPDFAQVFYLPPPIMVKDHLMNPVVLHPTESVDMTESSQRSDSSQPDDVETLGSAEMTGRSRRGDPIEYDDLETLGATEIILSAKDSESNSIFLTGKTPDGKLIKLDLERDSVAPSEIQKVVDIDSMIWVTQYPHFSHSIHIFSKPVICSKAPIFKHNHVYIDLIVPQTEADRSSLGPRTEWWVKTFKLFQIPHLQLGKMGDGAGSVNLLMAFPRMAHQHPYLGRWVNIIPSDVQNILWDQVIVPAM
jgi:hypothetical protein